MVAVDAIPESSFRVDQVNPCKERPALIHPRSGNREDVPAIVVRIRSEQQVDMNLLGRVAALHHCGWAPVVSDRSLAATPLTF
tara:strand:- start:94 stop:342 length:249 start_codon:yes stop_codon:yes gene_type:complete